MYTASLIIGGLDPFASTGLQAGLTAYLTGYLAGALLLLLGAAIAALIRRRGQRVHTLRWDRPAHLAERRPWHAHALAPQARMCRRVRH